MHAFAHARASRYNLDTLALRKNESLLNHQASQALATFLGRWKCAPDIDVARDCQNLTRTRVCVARTRNTYSYIMRTANKKCRHFPKPIRTHTHTWHTHMKTAHPQAHSSCRSTCNKTQILNTRIHVNLHMQDARGRREKTSYWQKTPSYKYRIPVLKVQMHSPKPISTQMHTRHTHQNCTYTNAQLHMHIDAHALAHKY